MRLLIWIFRLFLFLLLFGFAVKNDDVVVLRFFFGTQWHVPLVLVILSPAVWVAVLGHAEAIYPYDHPALFSMPLAFLVIVVVSRMDRSARAERERAAFDDQFVRAQTGLGAAAASSH